MDYYFTAASSFLTLSQVKRYSHRLPLYRSYRTFQVKFSAV